MSSGKNRTLILEPKSAPITGARSAVTMAIVALRNRLITLEGQKIGMIIAKDVP
jgi:hypothetical protein